MPASPRVMKGKCIMPSYKKYQTKKGPKWKFQLFVGRDPQGKQIIKTRSGFDTKKEASVAAAALEKQIHNESLLDNQYLTFKQVYHLWLDNYKLTVKESTANVTSGIVEYNILPDIGNKLVTELTPAECQKVVNYCFNRGLKSYKAMYNYLTNILDYAVSLKYLVENPAKAVIVPNAKQQNKKDLRFTDKSEKVKSIENYYTKDELKIFLDCAKTLDNKQAYPLFRLLAFTGARSGEICALTWSDIDFSNNSIAINKTRAYTSKGFVIQSPKTEHSNRVIFIDQKTSKIMKQWQIQQRKIMLILGYNVLNEKQLIFTDHKNRLLQNSSIKIYIDQIIKKTGLKKITPHGFRHTFATLAAPNMSPKELQNQLGHKDIATTLNIYTAVTETQMQSVPDKFTAFVNF